MSASSNILKESSRNLLREEEPGDDEVEFPNKDEKFSITSIRIVLVDSDLKSLCLMKNLMTQFSYQDAVPKLILKSMQEEMDVGLTRNNVASHLQKYRLSTGKKSSVLKETREDSQWRNAGPNNALTASKPLPNSSFGLQTRVPYFGNDQDARNGPMQYPTTNYFTMNNSHFITNSLVNLPYTDSFHQQQQPQQQFQHQQYYHSSLQLPSLITKQESPYVSADMENPDLIANQNSPHLDWGDILLEGHGYLDKTNRY
ncbi:putative two-component response regulator ARR20 [Hirschfeldia incana]|nr:putative two-component response regulator ARR20 [Hirschfeldia incana]